MGHKFVRPHSTILCGPTALCYGTPIFLRPYRAVVCGPIARSHHTRTQSRRQVTCSHVPISQLQFETSISHVFQLASISHQSQPFDAFARTVYSEARYAGAFYILPVLLAPMQDLPVRLFNFPCFYAMPAACPKLETIPKQESLRCSA